MQQHTGQHVLSQAFWEVLKGETRSFHLGPEVSTLEIGLGSVSDAALDKVEDRANAIVEVKSGAGGTEAMDWAAMLYRMYTRYSERKGWEVEPADLVAGIVDTVPVPVES